MFLSAGTTVKFHNWPQEENDIPDPEYSLSIPTIVTHASWCNDNNYLAILSEKSNPEIISTRDKNSARLVHTVQSVPDVTALVFQKTTKKYVALGTANAQVALYDTKHRAITKLYTNLTSTVRDVDFNIDDHCMAAACEDGSIVVYSLIGGDLFETLKLPNMARPTVLRFHPKVCNRLAGCSEKGDIVLWDIVTTRKIFSAQSHTNCVSGLAMTADDATLVSVGRDHKLCVFDINKGECAFRSNLHEPLTAVDVMADGHCMAIGSDDGNIYIYDMRRLVQPVHTFKPHSSRVSKILFANWELYKSKVVVPFRESVDTNISITDELDESQDGSRASKEYVVDSNSKFLSPTTSWHDNILYDNLKKHIVKTLRHHISDLSNKLSSYIASLKDVMQTEISTLDAAIEEKCLAIAALLMEDDKDSERSINETKEEIAF